MFAFFDEAERGEHVGGVAARAQEFSVGAHEVFHAFPAHFGQSECPRAFVHEGDDEVAHGGASASVACFNGLRVDDHEVGYGAGVADDGEVVGGLDYGGVVVVWWWCEDDAEADGVEHSWPLVVDGGGHEDGGCGWLSECDFVDAG